MFQSFVRSSTGTKPLFGSFSKAGFASAAKGLRKARVVVVGSGRMGQIRAGLIRASPRFELCGIVDTQIAAAQSLAEKFDVSNSSVIRDTSMCFAFLMCVMAPLHVRE
jgi:glutamyl-tRNA reductase